MKNRPKTRDGFFIPILNAEKSYYLCCKPETRETMLSKKTRYAMLAMISIARVYPHGQLTIRGVAASEHIPPRVLEGILLKLKNNGLLVSSRGKTGGYVLAKAPADISLLEIVVLFEDSVSMLACICTDEEYRQCEFCKDESTCHIRATFSSIYRHTAEVLRQTSLADLTADPKR